MSAFEPAAWERKIAGEDCPYCREHEASPTADPRLVAELASGRVLLQDDAQFRGYCILVFRRHAAELFELSAEERGQLMEDVSRVARAVKETFGPLKLNYAILGNLVPHVHVHVIPRYPDDGWWGQSPWARPDAERRTLSANDLEGCRQQLAAAMARQR